MRINEITYSLQGEGLHRGEPTVFIRFQGCSAHCKWCDTEYAQDFEGGKEMTPGEVEHVVRELLLPLHTRPWLCFTGGEPLEQSDDLYELIRRLTGRRHGGLRTIVETNGLHRPILMSGLVKEWCADIKCPSTGLTVDRELARFWMAHASGNTDSVKFVLANKADVVFALEMIERARTFPKYMQARVLVSPVMSPTGTVDRELAHTCWELCKRFGLVFSLQEHKIVYGNKRGV